MSNITKNKSVSTDVRLSLLKYWDLQLSTNSFDNYCCLGVDNDELISDINFDTTGETCSKVTWECAKSEAGDICDIGLTGIDNRYVNQLSGVTINLDGNLSYCMNRISGDTFCYQYNLNTGETVSYTSLYGGFYQGFYKLEGYEYEVLPERYYQGWTAEIWARLDDTLTGDCESKLLLNEVYPNNSGFIFYFGTRAENKFCNVFSGETGIDTCKSKVPLSPQFTIEVTGGTDIMNPFLYYTRSRICNPIDDVREAVFVDCCDGLANNALGLRVTNDGKLNLRLITVTGECNTNDYYIEDIIIENYETSIPIITDNDWHQFVIRFEPEGDPNPCVDSDLLQGNLSVFVDGFRKLFIKNLPEFKPYPLNVHPDKQLAVPYNMSVGGGTQGLLESVTFGGPDGGLPSTGQTVCFYEVAFNECNVFKGITIDNIFYEAPDLTVYEGDLICVFLTELFPNRISMINTELKKYGGKDTLFITIPLLEGFEIPQSINIGNPQKIITCPVELKSCIDLPDQEGKCGLLEQYFAGTFIGDIYNFRFYNKSLYIQDIRCNYETTLNILNN